MSDEPTEETPTDRTIVNDTSPIAFVYDPDKNPDNLFIEGVPLRTLTADDVAGYPD